MPDEPDQQVNAIVPDLEEARRFLQLLDPEATYFTFQVFEDDKDRQRREQAEQRVRGKRWTSKESIHHGPIDEVWEKVCLRNQNRYGLAVCPNGTDGRGRKNDNIIKRHTLWLDRDETLADLDSFIGTLPLLPQIVVETSPNRYHFYFLTEPFAPDEADQYPGFLKALADNFQGDRSAVSPCFTLRLPGSIHAKKDSKKGLEGIPHVVRIVRDEGGPRYPIDEVCKALSRYIKPEPEPGQKPAAAKRKLADINVPELRDALEAIPVNVRDNRKEWCEVGMALKLAGFPGARELWDTWSRASDQYDPVDQERTWNSFRVAEEDRPLLTLASIYALAKEHGFKPKLAPWRSKLIRLKHSGEVKDIPANVALILRNHEDWKGALRFDKLKMRPFKTKRCPLGEGEWDDVDNQGLCSWFADRERLAVHNAKMVGEVAEAVACDNTFDPLQDYLNGLKGQWDGVPRLETFFSDYCGTAQTAYTAWLGPMLFLGACKRALEPGCEHRYCLLLIGPQESGKSSFVRTIAGDWWTELSTSMDSKDVFDVTLGTWFVEIPELDAMRRADQKRVKSMISIVRNDWRPAYRRYAWRIERRNILIGTTNEDTPIEDDTGALRYFPIETPVINIREIKHLRNQFFAEAMELYPLKKETWWVIPEDVDMEVAELRQRHSAASVDPWVTKRAYLADPEHYTEFVTSAQLTGPVCLDLPHGFHERSAATKIGQIIKNNFKEWRRGRPKVTPEEQARMDRVRAKAGWSEAVNDRPWGWFHIDHQDDYDT